jgi:carbamoyltransferase
MLLPDRGSSCDRTSWNCGTARGRSLAAETGAQNLCLAGGVALNCVSNGKILRDGRFKNIWIQPAAGDAGGAIGAALAAYHIELDQPRAS